MKRRQLFQVLDYLIVSLLVVSVILFILVPFIFVFKEAIISDHSLDFSSMVALFKNQGKTITNTLKMGLLTTFFSSLSALATAIIIYLSSKNMQRVLLTLLSITLISPPFVTSLSFINLFGRRGAITYHLLGLSMNPYGLWGIVMMQTISNLSLNSLLLYSFIKSIDQDIINSARNLGANTSSLIKDIILPAAKPGLKAVVLLSFFRSIADFGTPAIIGGNFNVLAVESYFAVIAEGNLAKASAINVLLLIPSLLMFLFYGSDFKSMAPTAAGVTSTSEIKIKKSGSLYYLLLTISGFFLLAVTILYAAIVMSAFTKFYQGQMYFTLENFVETRPYITGTAIRSVVYSLISAIFGSIIGLLIGYYLKIRKMRVMKYVDFFANLPYIIPGTFFGLGYILAFKNPPLVLTGTATIVVLNVLFKQLPFSSRMGVAAMEGISTDTLNSIRDLGGSRVDEIKDAVIPLSREALSVSFVNAFTTTMTTIGSIIFLIYPGQKVLTLVMFDVIQSAKYNVGAVIALLIIVICLTVNGLYRLWMRRTNVSRS